MATETLDGVALRALENAYVIARCGQFDVGQRHGIAALGARQDSDPTFNHNGEVAGCLGVFGPRARVKDTDLPRFGALVIKAANAVSEQFGYRADQNAGGNQPKSRPDRKARGVA